MHKERSKSRPSGSLAFGMSVPLQSAASPLVVRGTPLNCQLSKRPRPDRNLPR